MPWERRRILIWGKTRPELSQTYREIVCTGGVFAHSRTLVRLYPIPLRYMDDELVFAKYNWIEADVEKAGNDTRPESYRIRADTIKVAGKIPTKKGGDWSAREDWILTPDSQFRSVEHLKDHQADSGTSLGIIKPAAITRVEARVVGASEKARFMETYTDRLRQMELPVDPETGRQVKPLVAADYRFVYHFKCDDDRCNGHEMSVLDWEVDASYFRMKKKYSDQSKASQMIVGELQKRASAEYDLRFFLGNIHNYPKTFMIVGLWYPKIIRKERGLFNGDMDGDPC